jgi:glycosyltransferase involved in cell wall biosynthesis
VVSVHCYGRQRWFYRHAAWQLGNRLFWLSPAMKRYYGVAKDDSWTQCIPGCVPALRPALPSRERRPREVLHLGGIGAVVRWKGWHVVVDAIAALPPDVRERVRFDHIGATGNTPDARRYAAELRAATARHGLDNVITWRGEQASSSEFLPGIDCLVVASKNEPFSIAVLEALSVGVPVLAADCGGAQDLIADGQCGWFFRRGESSHLAARIAMLSSTSALAEVKVTEELIRPFTAPVVAEQWTRVYAALTTADAHH